MKDDKIICKTHKAIDVSKKAKSKGEPCNQFIFTNSLRIGIMAGSVIKNRKRINDPSKPINQLKTARTIIANKIISIKRVTK